MWVTERLTSWVIECCIVSNDRDRWMMLERNFKGSCRGLLEVISSPFLKGLKPTTNVTHEFRSWCRSLNPGPLSTKPRPSRSHLFDRSNNIWRGLKLVEPLFM